MTTLPDLDQQVRILRGQLRDLMEGALFGGTASKGGGVGGDMTATSLWLENTFTQTSAATGRVNTPLNVVHNVTIDYDGSAEDPVSTTLLANTFPRPRVGIEGTVKWAHDPPQTGAYGPAFQHAQGYQQYLDPDTNEWSTTKLMTSQGFVNGPFVFWANKTSWIEPLPDLGGHLSNQPGARATWSIGFWHNLIGLGGGLDDALLDNVQDLGFMAGAAYPYGMRAPIRVGFYAEDVAGQTASTTANVADISALTGTQSITVNTTFAASTSGFATGLNAAGDVVKIKYTDTDATHLLNCTAVASSTGVLPSGTLLTLQSMATGHPTGGGYIDKQYGFIAGSFGDDGRGIGPFDTAEENYGFYMALTSGPTLQHAIHIAKVPSFSTTLSGSQLGIWNEAGLVQFGPTSFWDTVDFSFATVIGLDGSGSGSGVMHVINVTDYYVGGAPPNFVSVRPFGDNITYPGLGSYDSWDPFTHVGGETPAEAAAVDGNIENLAKNDHAFAAAMDAANTAINQGTLGAQGAEGATIYMPAGIYAIHGGILDSANNPHIAFMGEAKGLTTLFHISDGADVNGSASSFDEQRVCVHHVGGTKYWGKWNETGPTSGQMPITPVKNFTINGTYAADGSVGLKFGNADHHDIDLTIRNYHGSAGDNGIRGPRGTGSVGAHWLAVDGTVLDDSHARTKQGFTEQSNISLDLRDCYRCMVVDGDFTRADANGGVSFGYNRVRLFLAPGTGGGLHVINKAHLYGVTLNIKTNISNETPIIQIDGNNSRILGTIDMTGECNAAGVKAIPILTEPLTASSDRPAGVLCQNGGGMYMTGRIHLLTAQGSWQSPQLDNGIGSFHLDGEWSGAEVPRIGGWKMQLTDWGMDPGEKKGSTNKKLTITDPLGYRYHAGTKIRWCEGGGVGVKGTPKYGIVAKVKPTTSPPLQTILTLTDDSDKVLVDPDPGSVRYSYENPPDFPQDIGGTAITAGRNVLDSETPVLGIQAYRGDHTDDNDKYTRFEMSVIGGQADDDTQTLLSAGTILGRLQWAGNVQSDGSPGVSMGAFIRAITTENWDGPNHKGTSIQVATTAVNSSDPVVTSKFFDEGGFWTQGDITAAPSADNSSSSLIMQAGFALPLAIPAGIVLGRLKFQGPKGYTDSFVYDTGARIEAVSTAQWGSAPTALGARMDFYVTGNGLQNPDLALTLDQDLSTTVYGDLIVAGNITQGSGVSTIPGWSAETGAITFVSGAINQGQHFTVSGDKHKLYKSGTRIRWRQSGIAKWGVCRCDSVFNGTTTDVYLAKNSDYAMVSVPDANSLMYSWGNPPDYPDYFSWNTAGMQLSTRPTQWSGTQYPPSAWRFKVDKETVTLFTNDTAAGHGSTSAAYTATLPIPAGMATGVTRIYSARVINGGSGAGNPVNGCARVQANDTVIDFGASPIAVGGFNTSGGPKGVISATVIYQLDPATP